MAVCGRCLICARKFSCDEDDENVRWHCDECQHEHAICTWCHKVLIDDNELKSAVEDLLHLVRERSLRQGTGT